MIKDLDAIGNHPCFSNDAVMRSGGLFLDLAAACNMQCFSCSRHALPGDPSRAGTSLPVLSPDDVLEHVDVRLQEGVPSAGVIIGGPGEPLLGAQTYVVLRRLQWQHPDLPVRVWTNGLLLPDRLEDLVRSGVRSLTVSLNASTADTAALIYDWAVYRSRKYSGIDAARVILQQQWNGLENAVEAGISVTAYVVSIPGVNEAEVPAIRQRATDIGAVDVMVVPLRDRI